MMTKIVNAAAIILPIPNVRLFKAEMNDSKYRRNPFVLFPSSAFTAPPAAAPIKAGIFRFTKIPA